MPSASTAKVDAMIWDATWAGFAIKGGPPVIARNS
jgi:hypothetical protein